MTESDVKPEQPTNTSASIFHLFRMGSIGGTTFIYIHQNVRLGVFKQKTNVAKLAISCEQRYFGQKHNICQKMRKNGIFV